MKKLKLFILFCFMMINGLMAQTPPPPNNGDTGAGGSTPVGGGAPISGGLMILISIATAYAYGKYQSIKE